MSLPFFYKKENNSYPKLSSLISKSEPIVPISTPPTPTTSSSIHDSIEAIDENFFYKHLVTHFHSLFCESTIICIPHSMSIQGLVITKDIIESHCFQPSPYFCGQFMATKQKQKIVALDRPIISTIRGFKEERTVNIMDDETFWLKNKKIKLLLIDRLLEGEPPKHQYHFKHNITIPPIRNSRSDLDFLNMFSENLDALYELRVAVHEFTDSYVYIKGYNRVTVERIQHMYMKTYRTILERNKLMQESCRTPSEHDRFLELIENVVMSLLHKKIWIQSLQSVFSSQDTLIDTICLNYSHVTLSQYTLRYPISEMRRSSFVHAIEHFQRLNSDLSMTEPYKSTNKTLAFTPLEKLAVVKSTLDLISLTVHDYVQDHGNGNSDTSVTSDEMIPLLAFVIVQSNVPRIAGLIYYMQHYRLARMAEGSVYSFVITTMKSAVEFLKADPLSLMLNEEPSSLSRSTSVGSIKSVDLLDDDEQDSNTNVSRPHIVLPNPRTQQEVKDWYISQPQQYQQPHTYRRAKLGYTKPLVSTTPVPVDVLKLGRSLSATSVHHKKSKQVPQVITIRSRPSSICSDGVEVEETEAMMGDFLVGLGKIDGNVVGKSFIKK